jgi:hypothetical protein
MKPATATSGMAGAVAPPMSVLTQPGSTTTSCGGFESKDRSEWVPQSAPGLSKLCDLVSAEKWSSRRTIGSMPAQARLLRIRNTLRLFFVDRR